jgi:hypothetical protein
VELKLSQIRIDGGTQVRVALNDDKVEKYAADMKRGDKFPPLVAFKDRAGDIWLADGFHRLASLRSNKATTAEVDVREGTLSDAIWFACGANARHGLPLEKEDMKKVVEIALKHFRGSKSQREIADHCGVTQPYVCKIENALKSTDNSYQLPEKRLGRDGKMRPATRNPKPEITPRSRPAETVDPEDAPVATKPRVEPKPVAQPSTGEKKLTKAQQDDLQQKAADLLWELDCVMDRMDALGRHRTLIYVERVTAKYRKENAHGSHVA